MQSSPKNPHQSRFSNFAKCNLVTCFFIALCFFNLLMVNFLSGQNIVNNDLPKTVDTRFEILNFKYYKISPLGVEVLANGVRGTENKHQENELEDLQILRYLFSSNIQENLHSKLAIYANNEVRFPQGVFYIRDNVQFWSETATYSPNKKEFQGQGNFIISSEKYRVKGKNILYKEEKVYAYDISGFLKK